MILYIRKINDYNWEVENKTELNGEAITIDLMARKNEWSVFKVNIDEIKIDDEEIEKVVLYLFIKFPKKVDFDGISIALIDDETLYKYNISYPVEPKKMDNIVEHMNIKNVDYKMMNNGMDMLIDIVNNQTDRLLNYSVRDMYNIINKYSEYFSREFTKFRKDDQDNIQKIFMSYGFKKDDFILKK